MLNVIFGDVKEAIFNTSVYFDNTYLDSWITNPFGKKIIKKIDKAEVLSAQAVDSHALGVIPVTKISGGAKTLLLVLNEPEKIFNVSTCGNNCAPLLLEIADKLKKDVTVNLRHIMDFGDRNFNIKVLNVNKIAHNMKEFVEILIPLLHQEA